jgi:hypothetical protein
MVEHPLVDLRTAGDAIHPRAGKTLRGKFGQRSFENPFLGLMRIAYRSGFLVHTFGFHQQRCGRLDVSK